VYGSLVFLVMAAFFCVAITRPDWPPARSRRPRFRREREAQARIEADERARAERAAQGARDELALKQMMYIDLVWSARRYLEALTGSLAAARADAAADAVAGVADASEAAARAFTACFERVRASLPAEVLVEVRAASRALDETRRRIRVGSAFERLDEARRAVAGMAVAMRADLGVGGPTAL
jgi:hypothetical protein